MSAKKSKTFFKTLTAILVLLLFFGGYYIYSSGIFGASVTENISEHSITDEERLIEYEEYGITYDESSQSYLYQDSLIIFNTQITFAFFFSFTIHLSVLALQITVELVSKNFFANL